MSHFNAIKYGRIMAMLSLLLGGAGSFGFLITAGHHTPVFLLLLFIGWVLSPFIALLFAVNNLLERWSFNTRMTLYFLMFLLSLSSIVSYSGLFSFPGRRPAFIFLVVPFVSWLMIGVSFMIVRNRSSKNKKV